MTKIIKASLNDCQALASLGKQTFLESHGHSAPLPIIDEYIGKTYSVEALESELNNPDNQYYLIYGQEELVGFSNIRFNCPNPNIQDQDVTILDRIYILKKYYGQQMGTKLLQFNMDLAQQNHQKGFWLATWIENQRSIQFYTKMGFKIVGSYDFYLSDAHSNPNHIMYLKF